MDYKMQIEKEIKEKEELRSQCIELEAEAATASTQVRFITFLL